MVKQRLNRFVSLLVAILLVGAAACTESNTGQIATPETPTPIPPTIICQDGSKVVQSEYEALLALSPLNNDSASDYPFYWIVAECANQHVTAISWNNMEGETLPPQIGSFPNLIALTILGENLSSLPPEIGNLTNLTGLGLSSNTSLTSLPPEIGNLNK